MQINIAHRKSVKIVEMVGELNLSTSETVMAHLDRIKPGDPVIFDLSGVHYMTSTGIRTLLRMYRTVHEQGGNVVLTGLSDSLREVLFVTGFLEFFRVEPDIKTAVHTLKRCKQPRTRRQKAS